MRPHAAFGSIVFLLSVPAAAGPRVELHWRADEGCIDEATLAATVERTLDAPIFHEPKQPAAVLEGEVVRTSDGYHAHVVLRSTAPAHAVLAEREIGTTAPDCARLDDSLAVVVAMMVDGVHELPSPLRVPPRPPRPRPGTLAPAPAPKRTPITGELEAGAAAAIGLLPDVSPGGYVRGGVGIGRWSLDLAASGWAPSNATELGSGARISAWTGELAGCGALVESSRARLRGCVVFGAGFTDATPIALQGGAETQLPIVFEGLAVDGSLRLAGPVYARLRVAVWNPIVVPSYYFYAADGSTRTLPAPWILEPGFSLGLGVRWGS